MNEQSPKPVPARIKKNTTLSSFVWLVPLIALITGAWLIYQNIRNTGPEITLLMDSAEGIEVNTTVIKVLNVDVGRVTRIRLRDDRKGVEIRARLNADVKDLMRKDTQFWVVKPRIDQSGISGLNTLVSGSYIAFTPGKDEDSESIFKVSDIPPIAAIGQRGLRLHLVGDNRKMLTAGSPILFEGFNVGVVETANFNADSQTVDYTIFINSPNDKLINTESQFWLESGVNIQTTGSGIKIDSAPIYTLLTGAISFRTPKTGKPVVNEDTFELYNNLAQIENLPDERSLYYVAFFKSSIRGLSPGAPVEYKGINIGSVAEVPYFAGNDSSRLFQNGWVPVRLRIDPSRIEKDAEPQSKSYWQNQLNQALAKGLNATISSNNLILGSKMIELTDAVSGGNTLKPLANYNGNTVIPTHSSGLDDLQAQISNLLNKFNKLPLENTVGELNASLKELKATLASANTLISKPQTRQIPAELNKTLAELRQALQGISPQSPVYQDVQSTLKSLDKTMREAQPVLNTLKEKPNSLIFNQNAKDPTPKGSR